MIIDAHHHIWRQNDLPWLKGPMQPRIFGPYEPIMRDYGIAEYLADLQGQGVRKSVYVQANWAVDQFVDEAQWVQGVAEQSGWPHGIVAFADFTVDDVRPQLDRLAKIPLVRGIRQQMHWHKNPMYRFAKSPDMARDSVFQRNIGYLAEYNWVFDLQLFSGQMQGGAELAAACPNVTFTLQHAGMLEETSQSAWSSWRQGMRALAAMPNVVSKLSGLGTFEHKVDPNLIASIWQETFSLFGADRCLWGSNFPIEKLWTSYADLLAAHKQAATTIGASDANKIFHNNAQQIYRL